MTTVEKKVHELLLAIYETYKFKGSIGITSICKNHKMPYDYSAFLADDGVITIVRGGKRGPSIKRWVGGKPSLEYAQKLLARYNDLRNETGKKLYREKTILQREQQEELTVSLDEAGLNQNSRAIKKSIISEAKQVDKEIENDQLLLGFSMD